MSSVVVERNAFERNIMNSRKPGSWVFEDHGRALGGCLKVLGGCSLSQKKYLLLIEVLG